MHPIAGADYITASGERRYKGTDPATVVHQDDLNQILLSLHRIIETSGQTLDADPATSLADNWMKLTRAVNRLARTSEPVSVVMDEGPAINLGLTLDTFHFRIDQAVGGDEVDGEVYIENSAGHIDRLIVIHNGTSSRKFIQTAAAAPLPSQVPLAPGQSAFFLSVLQSASVVWVTLDGQGSRTEGTLTALLGAQGSSDASAEFDIEYHVNHADYNTRLIFPASASIGLSAPADSLYMVLSGNNPFPNLALPSIDNRIVPVWIDNNSVATREIGFMRYTPAAGGYPNQWRIFRGDESQFDLATSSTWRVHFPELSFKNRE